MKKRLIALALAVAMAFTSSLSVFASALDNSDYEYHSTEELEVSTITENNAEKIVLTWPAVDTNGNVIKANPLKSTSSYGNPTGGWTLPLQGMIIAYDGWNPDGSATSITTDSKTTHPIIKGLTTEPSDKTYPVALMAYDENLAAYKTGTAYIDTTVVADSFATAYVIEYSNDGGQTWKEDHTVSTVNHGPKLYRTVTDADGNETTKQDIKNTFFLRDQYTETIETTLESETEYIIRVSAFDASTPSTKSTPYKTFETTFTTPRAKQLKPAFPTVEGGGTMSQGGRNGDVYVVTNLTDSVSNPQPGSLRYGLERKDRADGNSSYPRIIVFAVGGTIEVDPTATKSQRRINVGSNTTILGQTAPGEGITLKGMSLKIDGENIITRYIRTRLGAGYDQDAASASGKNIVVDHCSFEWGTDETFSAKELLNSSIQYNIIASGLAMVNKNGDLNTDAEIVSAESEAKHGMGSLINGYETSITHNLWAHNGTRNPRFEGGFEYLGTRYENKLDFANNVVYNWGHDVAYGGERGNAEVNYVNNYFKSGPNTLEKVKDYIFDADGGGYNGTVYKSSYYVSGNVLEGNSEVTENNTVGFKDGSVYANFLTSPVSLTTPYEAETAETAYNSVINSVGASYARDAQDNRLLNDVITGTGRFINDPVEAGGYETDIFTSALTDEDKDGLPDDWETSHGLDPTDSTDSASLVDDADSPYDGYSWIEIYASEILGEWDGTPYSQASADKLNITSITDENGSDIMSMAATKLEVGKAYKINLDSYTEDEYYVYLNDEVIAQSTDGNITFTPEKEGVYNLMIKSSTKTSDNTYAEKTFSELIPVVVITNKDNNLNGFTASDIGDVPEAGFVSYDNTDGTMILGGSGKVGITATTSTVEPDSFFYNYKQVTGDMSIIAKVNPLVKLDYYQKAGVMMRSSLDPDSEFYMSGVTYLKGEDYEGQTDAGGGAVKAKNVRSFSRSKTGGAVASGSFVGIPLKRLSEEPNYGWVKLTREGQTVTTYGSLDGLSWTLLNEFTTTLPETYYVGFAIDAVQDTMSLVRYNAAEFSEIGISVSSNDLSDPDGSILLGDATVDGKLTAADSLLVLQYAKGRKEISEEGLKNADLNGTGIINARTAALILKKVKEADYKFPVE